MYNTDTIVSQFYKLYKCNNKQKCNKRANRDTVVSQFYKLHAFGIFFINHKLGFCSFDSSHKACAPVNLLLHGTPAS